jgi:hypothetical protein
MPIGARGLVRRVLEHVALVLLGVGGPLAYLFASPIYSSGDEAAHVDYALQVWHGHLPVFEQGLALQNTVGVHPPVQWTSHHPPLVYLLLAPVVGPLVDAGHVDGAGMAARAVMVLLSVALLYAVRAVGHQLLPSVRGAGLTSAVVVGLSVWFVRLGGSVYTDTPAALVSALAFLALLRLALGGARRRDAALFVAACAACGLTRFSLLPVVALFALALVVVGHLSGRRGPGPVPGSRAPGALGPGRLRPTSAWATALGAGAAVVATSGWFYLRNRALTGNFSGSHPEWAAEHTPRVARPVLDVAVEPGFWTTMTQQMSLGSYPRLPRAIEPALPWTLLLAALPLVVGLALAVVRIVRGRERRAVQLVLLATVLAACGGVACMQVAHAAGGGSAFARYFFAMVPFLAPFMALALLRLHGTPLVLWALARVTLLGLELELTLQRQLRGPQADLYPVPTWWAYGIVIAGLVLALALVVTRGARSGPRHAAPEADGRPADEQPADALTPA